MDPVVLAIGWLYAVTKRRRCVCGDIRAAAERQGTKDAGIRNAHQGGTKALTWFIVPKKRC